MVINYRVIPNLFVGLYAGLCFPALEQLDNDARALVELLYTGLSMSNFFRE